MLFSQNKVVIVINIVINSGVYVEDFHTFIEQECK